MTSRRIRRIVFWLLPLFALRGLVPAGLMPHKTAEGGLTFVFCEGIYAVPSAVNEHSAHAGHVHHHPERSDTGSSDTRQPSSQHDASICPFAVGGSAAGAQSFAALSIQLESVHDVPVLDVVSFHGLFGPSRAQQSRAPPSFS